MNNFWVNLLLVMAGGAAGAGARYLTLRRVAMTMKHVFPWPTITVNLAGCFLMGAFWALLDKHGASKEYIPFIVIGFFGSYTTFSTFANETVLLIREKLYKKAVANILMQNIGGLLLCISGHVSVSALMNIL